MKLKIGLTAAAALILLPVMAGAQGILYVQGGKVGINEPTPIFDLDVLGALQVKKDAATANIRFNNGNGQVWNFQNNGTSGNFAIRDLTASSTPFKIEPGAPGNLFTLTSAGQVQILGTTVHPDYVFEPFYNLEPIEDHVKFMMENKHLPAVGPGSYTQDGQPVITIGARSQGMLEELEKAHLYIAQLNEQLKATQAANQELAERLTDLEESIAK
jgi:hypothetical protein